MGGGGAEGAGRGGEGVTRGAGRGLMRGRGMHLTFGVTKLVSSCVHLSKTFGKVSDV